MASNVVIVRTYNDGEGIRELPDTVVSTLDASHTQPVFDRRYERVK